MRREGAVLAMRRSSFAISERSIKNDLGSRRDIVKRATRLAKIKSSCRTSRLGWKAITGA